MYVTSYNNKDIVLFQCATIHAILKDKNTDIVRTKVYLDIYNKDIRSKT